MSIARISVEAELQAPGILVQIGSYDRDKPLETLEHNTIPSLTLLLSPLHNYAEGYFAVDEGRGQFCEIGDVVFAPADVHLRVRASGGPIRLVRCFFEAGKFQEITGHGGRWGNDELRSCLNLKHARLRETLARLGQEALSPGLASRTLTEGLGMFMAVELGRHFQAIEAHSKLSAQKLSPWQVNRITQYVENLSNYLPDVSDIAELCGISARHLRRLFKETTNQTIYQYSRDVWAAKAKTMLSDTKVPVKEIASCLGFADSSSFSIAFRRATGEAPKTFRQQFRKPRLN